MLNIDKISYINNKKCNKVTTQTFTSNDEKPQVNELPKAQTDFSVKTPIKYQKTGEISLPCDLQAHCYKLANGQRVVIVPKDGSTIVKTYVNTGSLNEPDNVRGISHYIEHNLFNGSDGLEAGEFWKATDNMGAKANASTGLSSTNYYIKSNLLKDEDLENSIKLHASMIETPKFALEALEKEKGIVNSEIVMYQGYADNIAENRVLKNLYNIQSTSGDLIAGTTQNINNITREDVIDYYNNNYYPANMVTVITGEVKPDEAMALVSKYFSGTNKVTHPRKFEKLTPITKTMREDITTDKTTSTKIVLGFDGYRNNDAKNKVCEDVVNMILSSESTGRLYKELKPYNTSASFYSERISSNLENNRVIGISVDTTEQNCEQVLQGIYNQVYSLTTDTNFDLESIKKRLKNTTSDMYEYSGFINSSIGNSLLDENMDYVVNYNNILDSITKEDIVNFAKKYLDLNRTAITVLHPKDKVKQLAFTGNINKQVINPDNVQQYVANNNFSIITNNTKSDGVNFDLTYSVKDIPKSKPATSYILNELLQEGSGFRDDVTLYSDLQKKGIKITAGCNSSSMFAIAKSSQEDSQETLGTMFEILQNPRFTEDAFNSAKNRITQRFSLMEKNANDKLYSELYKNLPLGYTNKEILDSAKNVTLEDVRELYNSLLNTSQANVTISTNFGKNPQLKNILFNEICNKTPVKPYKPFIRNTFEPVKETKVLTDTDTKSQAEVIEAFKFEFNGNMKDKMAILLLNEILGGNSSSRLFTDLRETQQLAYHVGSNINFIDNSGLLNLSIGTTTDDKMNNEKTYDNIQKSINGFNKNIQKILTEKVSEDELEHAKLSIKNNVYSGNESGSAKNSTLANGITGLYGPLAVNENLKMLDTITVDDIYNVANYIFKNKPTYSIVATEDTLKANNEYFKQLEQG